MANFWAKLGFRKADEMERAIQLKAIRLAWCYTVVFLLGWTFYESYRVYQYHTRLNLFPCLLLVTQNLVLILSQLYFTKKVSTDEGEGGAPGFGRSLLLAALIALAVGAVGCILLLAR